MKPASYLALLPLIIFSPARAQDYEHGNALLCDTQKEVERYVELPRERTVCNQHRQCSRAESMASKSTH